MTNIEYLEQKISTIRKFLKELEHFRQYDREAIEKNTIIRLALERILYLLAQSTIDLADAVVSTKKYRKPTSLSESFQVLYENGHITQEILGKMIAMTGFRNVVAHDYLKIDYNIVYSIVREGYKDIEYFIESIQRV